MSEIELSAGEGRGDGKMAIPSDGECFAPIIFNRHQWRQMGYAQSQGCRNPRASQEMVI